ncbi:hypothetical protein M885DRAFT_521326 [Pelagophyceae sp. CCMP2097]|nr:hypothetical protein M885DRAFT_521326 [Pelagophyceae sp. CCMP2097]
MAPQEPPPTAEASVSDLLTCLFSNIALDALKLRWASAAKRAAEAEALRSGRRIRGSPGLSLEAFVGLMRALAKPKGRDLAPDAVVDLFTALDSHGQGEVKWDTFTSFVLDIDVPADPRAALADAGRAMPRAHEVPRRRQYGKLSAVWNQDFALHGVASMVYLPPPMHKLLVTPARKHCEVVHVLTPDDPPRLAGTLRHHTVYRAHKVLCAAGIPHTSLVVTASTAGDSFLNLWYLPQKSPDDDNDGAAARPKGRMIPVLVQRLVAPSEQSTLHFSERSNRLFTSGLDDGLVHEWEIKSGADSHRLGELSGTFSNGDFFKRRSFRLHAFGVTSIVEVHRRLKAQNIIVTGSTEGLVRVWNPSDWDSHTYADGAGEAVSGRDELVPLLQLNGNAAGTLLLVYSSGHEMLFSAGCFASKDASAATTTLVWRFRGQTIGTFERRACAALERHAAPVVAMHEVPAESHLVTVDAAGYVIVARLPDLCIHQTLHCHAASARVAVVPVLREFVGDSRGAFDSADAEGWCLFISAAARCDVFSCALEFLREPVLACTYLASEKALVVTSGKRVAVWDATTGLLKKQFEAGALLRDAPQSAAPGSAPAVVADGAGGAPGIDSPNAAPREIVAAAVSTHGRLIVLGDELGGLHACDLAVSAFSRCRKLKALDPHDGPVNCIAIIANGGDALCVSAGASDGTIAVSDESRQVGFRRADVQAGMSARSARLRDVKILGSDPSDLADVPVRAGPASVASAARTLPVPSSSCAAASRGGTSRAATLTNLAEASGRSLFDDSDSDSASDADEDDSPAPEAQKEKQLEHEVLFLATDAHLNLMASISRPGGRDASQVCVWDLELFSLLGSCVLPPTALRLAEALRGAAAAGGDGELGRSPEAAERLLCVAFVSPYPILAGASSAAAIYLWRVPKCTILCVFDQKILSPHRTLAPKYEAPESAAGDDAAGEPPAGDAAGAPDAAAGVEDPPAGDQAASGDQGGWFVGCLKVLTALTFDEGTAAHGAVLLAGGDGGCAVSWSFENSFFADRDCRAVAAVRRKNYNLKRALHAHVDVAALIKSRRHSHMSIFGIDRAQVMEDTSMMPPPPRRGAAETCGTAVPAGGTPAAAPPGGSPRPVIRTCWQAHKDSEVTAVEAWPGAVATCFENGVVKIWAAAGRARWALVGQLDINSAQGSDAVPWTFAPKTPEPDRAARATVERRKTTSLLLAAALDDAPVLAVSQSAPKLAIADRADWDGVFESMSALESSFQLSSAFKTKPNGLGRHVPRQHGTAWRTNRSVPALAFLASELPAARALCPPLGRLDARPARHALQKAASIEELVQRRGHAPGATTGATTAFPRDASSNHLARMTRLRHMGCPQSFPS